ncbi:MAG: hypothetical protein H7A23_25585 [Leptospiraceae bacterium]|nr:hypothetical protein [Leptospiraceae bacterium]
MTKRVVIVLGMHRSGTSLITKALETMGVELGDNLLGGRVDNPKGFREDKKIITLNSALLKLQGGNWSTLFSNFNFSSEELCTKTIYQDAEKYINKEFQHHPLWGFKDPRTCILLPFWTKLLEKLGYRPEYLIVLRNPLSIIQSLWKRDLIDKNDSSLLYIQYFLPLLKLYLKQKACVVDYDYFMEDSRQEYYRISKELNLTTDPKKMEEFLNDFLSKNLRHNTSSKPNSNDSEIVYQAWNLYIRSFTEIIKNDTNQLEKIYSEYDRLYHDFVQTSRMSKRKFTLGMPLLIRYGSAFFTFLRHLKYMDLSFGMLKLLFLDTRRNRFKKFFQLHNHGCEKD